MAVAVRFLCRSKKQSWVDIYSLRPKNMYLVAKSVAKTDAQKKLVCDKKARLAA
jgi:hypothetical protein